MIRPTLQTAKSERLSYGGFFLGQNMIYVLQLQFLVYFYTEYVGLTLGATTLMLLVARLWDAINDPIMGAIVDKCNFKRGKYLPWIRAATILVPLSTFLLFVELDASYTTKLIYAYATYLLWDMMYTVSDSPIFSLSTVMTSNLYERDKLQAYGRVAAAIAAITSAAFMSMKGMLGWQGAVGVYCLVAFLVMVPLSFTAKERIVHRSSEQLSFVRLFLYLFKNKYLLIFYAGYLAINGTNTLQIVAVYFANSNLGDEGLLTIILATTILPVILIAPLLPAMIQKLGKKRLTIYSCLLAIALSILQYFAGYESFGLFLALSTVRVMVMQIPLLIYGMFTADCIEYGAAVNGERAVGIAFSLQTLVTKLTGALAATLVLTLMSYFGYVEQSSHQTESALEGIWIILTLVPAIGYVGMLIAMYFYRLDERAVAVYMEANLKRSEVEQHG